MFGFVIVFRNATYLSICQKHSTTTSAMRIKCDMYVFLTSRPYHTRGKRDFVLVDRAQYKTDNLRYFFFSIRNSN